MNDEIDFKIKRMKKVSLFPKKKLVEKNIIMELMSKSR